MSSSSQPDKELDLGNCERGIWLVKVPKYIANHWDRAPSDLEVGKLKIVKSPGQKPSVSFVCSESMLCLKEPGEEPIPKEHKFVMSNILNQTMGVFSQSAPNLDAVIPEPERLSLEGKIVQKAECRPLGDTLYMNLKAESIRKAAQPVKKVVQLDKVVHTFKPRSNHDHNIKYEEKKKAEGKKSREDREKVMEMLFAAFEKHQYYNIKDLVRITRQPVTYLKEVLKDVCSYNLKNPHKNMWELKPEYRHYKKDDEDD